MRLIDADEMMADELEEYTNAQPNKDKITAGVNYVVHFKIQRRIENKPTAFDYAAVLKELETKRQEFYQRTLSIDTPPGILQVLNGICKGMDRAIEIFKGGLKDGKEV